MDSDTATLASTSCIIRICLAASCLQPCIFVSHHPKTTPNWIDYALLIALSLIFGSSFIFTSISVRDIPPLTVVTLRLGIALILLCVFVFYSRAKLPAPGRIWIYIIASALFGNAIPFSLISWGQVTVEAGLTAIFMAVMPLATIFLAQFFTDDEKLNRWKIASVLCGLAGVIILMGPAELGTIGDDTIRQLAILSAAVCYAINAIITRKLVTLPRLPMVTALLLSSTALMLPICLMIDQPWQVSYTLPAINSVLVLAAGPTAFATWLILVIIDRQGASFLSQINFILPLVAVALGSYFLAERLPVNAYIALGVILLAIALSRRGEQK